MPKRRRADVARLASLALANVTKARDVAIRENARQMASSVASAPKTAIATATRGVQRKQRLRADWAADQVRVHRELQLNGYVIVDLLPWTMVQTGKHIAAHVHTLA